MEYLDVNNVYILNKTFEAWSSGTRVNILELLEPEGNDSRKQALVRIESIQVVVPLSYLTKRRERTGTTPQLNSRQRRKLRKDVLKDAPMLGEVRRDG
jgi:hypothetical protein